MAEDAAEVANKLRKPEDIRRAFLETHPLYAACGFEDTSPLRLGDSATGTKR